MTVSSLARSLTRKHSSLPPFRISSNLHSCPRVAFAFVTRLARGRRHYHLPCLPATSQYDNFVSGVLSWLH